MEAGGFGGFKCELFHAQGLKLIDEIRLDKIDRCWRFRLFFFCKKNNNNQETKRKKEKHLRRTESQTKSTSTNMIFKQALILLLIALTSSISSYASTVYFDNQRSLVRPELSSTMSLDGWDFGGHSTISHSAVQLTTDKQSQLGFLYCKKPVDYPNWEVKFKFNVHGETGHLYGDGFAFWYTEHRLRGRQGGPVFGNRDYFKGLAVFFDTYSNHNGEHNHGHPYISVMVNDGSLHYDHDTDGTHTELAGCEATFRNLGDDDHAAARIVYKDFKFALYYSTKYTAGEEKKCFEIEGVYLPTNYFWGFTAATGDVSDTHEIKQILTYHHDFDEIKDVPEEYANSRVTPHVKNPVKDRPHAGDGSGSSSSSGGSDSAGSGGDGGMGFFGWLFVLIVIGGVVGGIAYVLNEKKKERNNKRFF